MASQIIRSPRKPASTSNPVMNYLPALVPGSRCQVPRRYEETKPVLMQNFTHNRIITLGEMINKRTLEETGEKQRKAVEKAINDAWEEAQIVKEQAVSSALQSAKVEQNKALKKLEKAQDRAVKEEALRVEAIMQKKMREALEEEREAGEKRLQATMALVRKECELEKDYAVCEAQKEERRIADEKSQLLQDAALTTLNETITKLTNEKELSLRQLDVQKEKEKLAAVNEAHLYEQQVASEQLKKIKLTYEAEITKLLEKIKQLEDVIMCKDKELETVQQKREGLFNELLRVEADYQSFIDRHPLFDPGQSGYLLPPMIRNAGIEDPRKKV